MKTTSFPINEKIRVSLIFVYTIAVAILSSCDHVSSASGDALAEEAFQHLDNDQYEKAIPLLEKALAKSSASYSDELLYTCIGNAQNELGQLDQAIKSHEKALSINPDFHEAWVNLGIVYRLTNEYEKAEECYKRALKLEPEYAELHASLGALYIFQEKYEESIEHLEKAINLDSQLAVAWANLSLVYAISQEFEKADEALQRAQSLGYKRHNVLRVQIEALKQISESPLPNNDSSHSLE